MRLDTHRLRSFLAKQKMATLEALKRALGTAATMTGVSPAETLALSHQLFPPREVLHPGRHPAVR